MNFVEEWQTHLQESIADLKRDLQLRKEGKKLSRKKLHVNVYKEKEICKCIIDSTIILFLKHIFFRVFLTCVTQ